MKGKLALEINNIVYRSGDKLALVVQEGDKEKIIEGIVGDIFESVYPSHIYIRLNGSANPIDIENVNQIYKVH